MLSYLWIGANDVDASVAFYDSILLPLGYEKDYSECVCSYSLLGTVDRLNGPGTVHVGKPFDGGPATAGNGMMPAFRTQSRAEVDAIYVTALGQGGVGDTGCVHAQFLRGLPEGSDWQQGRGVF